LAFEFSKQRPVIGVDPDDLTQKAVTIGDHPEVILAGRRINDRMGAHVAERVVKLMLKQGIDLSHSRVLVLGLTFEETHLKPKPMIEIGGRPILWHIMKLYSAHGVNDFVICCGYKGYLIKEYFANDFLHMSDVTFDRSTNQMEVHQRKAEPWRVTLVDTGDDILTGGRLKRVAEYLKDQAAFCFTYGDGVSDIDISALIRFHNQHQRWATVTAGQPPGRYGALERDGDQVTGFVEKPRGDGGLINGGFFVLSPRCLDLIIGNNVYAHVPDLNDFTAGLKAALKPSGTVTLEFPHLLQLIAHSQFDTVYHEHFSDLSLHAVQRILQAQALRLWDVEQLPTHGGSLRIDAIPADDPRPSTAAVAELLATEQTQGLRDLATYQAFQPRANRVKNDLLAHLIEQQRAGRRIAAYGAAAKGNTLLNYAGIKPDLLPYVCDAAPAKQGKYLPGSHIPIRAPAALCDEPPDEVLILPWNIADEVRAQLADLAEQGARFVTAVPSLNIS
jgi:glucose-1-phosphate cytidylyltransferase